MRRLRAPLDTGRALFVRRPSLTIGGRTFVQGDEFPWRDLGLSERKLEQLWDQGRVRHEPPPVTPVAPVAKPKQNQPRR